MQCNQPFWFPGFQNNVQSSPYHMVPQHPQVIGEGDVMSLTLPDGSIQCYFVPVNRRDRWIPYPNLTNCNNPNIAPVWPNPNNEAWFVRSILNTYPTEANQQVSNHYGSQCTRSPISLDLPVPRYIQKFHNDNWTSTTDLHYFYPRLRKDCFTKGCTAVQVEIPHEERTIFHYGTVCKRPCYCSTNECTTTETNSDGSCCNETPMSVDDIKSDIITQCHCEQPQSRERKSYVNMGSKATSCECHTRSTMDTSNKQVSTFTDQASSCCDIKIREKWNSRKARTKKNKITPNTDLNVCDSACCLGSPCSDM